MARRATECFCRKWQQCGYAWLNALNARAHSQSKPRTDTEHQPVLVPVYLSSWARLIAPSFSVGVSAHDDIMTAPQFSSVANRSFCPGFTNLPRSGRIWHLNREHSRAVWWPKGGRMEPQSSTELPSPKEYRAFADECLRWANRAPSQAQRNTLVEIARVWMQIALDKECKGQTRKRAPQLTTLLDAN